MSLSDLEPIEPAQAIDWYLDHRQQELQKATRRSHRSGLGIFQRWAESQGISNLNELSGRDLVAFKTWRKSESNINIISLNGNLATLRRFLRFCERIEAIEQGLADKVPLPNVPKDMEVKTEVPPEGLVDDIRYYLDHFDFASRAQSEFELIAEVGIRLGAVRAIDIGDFDKEDNVIHLRHRPEKIDAYGTPLKNGSDGERIVNISEKLGETLSAYIGNKRTDVRDKFGRKALFTTPNGRITTATIRRDFYKFSRPCEVGNGCPHDRDIQTCEATNSKNPSACPSSFSTHPLRKWSIMSQLDDGIPKEILSDRVDVSVPILEKHYDQRTQERKSRQRRSVLAEHLEQFSDSK